MRICLLLLPLLFLPVIATNRRMHMSDICIPQVSRNQLYQFAIDGAVSTFIDYVVTHNGQKGVSVDKMTDITNMFGTYVLANRNIGFILKLLLLQCQINKPVGPAVAPTSEEAFLCIWELQKEACYKYVDKAEGEVTLSGAAQAAGS